MTIRVEAKGVVSTGKLAEVDARFTTNSESFREDLGKAIYGVETTGFSFDTSEVYDEAVAKFETVKHLLKPNRYTVIYNTDGLAVKVLA